MSVDTQHVRRRAVRTVKAAPSRSSALAVSVARSGARPGRSCSPSRSSSASGSSCLVRAGPPYVLPSPAEVFTNRGRSDDHDHRLLGRHRHHHAAGRRRLLVGAGASAPLIGSRSRGSVAPTRSRLAHHRPADHAVDRVVPARDPAVRHQRDGDLLRRRPRRRTQHRQRCHLRHRPRPTAYVRLGKVLGAKGLTLYRYIVLPAALPSFVAGLSQGWAFAWRCLMAGELLVVIAGESRRDRPEPDFARELISGRGDGLDDRDLGHRHGRRHHLHLACPAACGGVVASPSTTRTARRTRVVRNANTPGGAPRLAGARTGKNGTMHVSAKVDYAMRALLVIARDRGRRTPSSRATTWPPRSTSPRDSSRGSCASFVRPASWPASAAPKAGTGSLGQRPRSPWPTSSVRWTARWPTYAATGPRTPTTRAPPTT